MAFNLRDSTRCVVWIKRGKKGFWRWTVRDRNDKFLLAPGIRDASETSDGAESNARATLRQLGCDDRDFEYLVR